MEFATASAQLKRLSPLLFAPSLASPPIPEAKRFAARTAFPAARSEAFSRRLRLLRRTTRLMMQRQQEQRQHNARAETNIKIPSVSYVIVSTLVSSPSSIVANGSTTRM